MTLFEHGMARMAHIHAEDVGAGFVEPLDERDIDGGRAQSGHNTSLPLVMGHGRFPNRPAGLLQITQAGGTLSCITVEEKGDAC
jgi:hypothetical protein